MTGSGSNGEMRTVAREVLGELMRGLQGDAPAEIVPQVPAPPVAAVLRPSTWSSPAAPGEVIGDGTATPAATQPAAPVAPLASDIQVEPVTIDTDEDLDRFVRALLARTEDPRDRLAIRAGRLRFSLQRSTTTPVAAGAEPGGRQAVTVNVVKGAVTERAVRAAAAQHARLVLARGAVLTPLARDCARALGVEIERERTC